MSQYLTDMELATKIKYDIYSDANLNPDEILELIKRFIRYHENSKNI